MTSSYQGQSPPTTYMHHHHHIRRHRVPSGGEDPEEEELDPRIQIELERLNRASEEINRLELELDDARAAFRTALSDSTQRLNGLAKKLGACVDKARPYYDARMKLKEAHLESQKAALKFERACSMHEAAKEMVQLAEEGYKRREQDLDPTWQEMLNHATMKVNDAERERIESEDFHQRTTLNFKHKEEEVQRLQKDLKRSITKSKPYFEMKAKFNQVMEERKRAVSRLEEDVASTKALYSQALRSLEAISDDIHRQRLERRQKLELGVRGAGVGAESPSPPPWEKGSNIEGSASCQYTGDSDHGKYLPSVEKVHSAPLFTRPTGIICHETAFRKKASLTDNLLMDGKFKTDPLDVVVFKTSTASPKGGITSYTNSPVYDGNDSESPTEIYSYTNRARSASYRAAIEMSSKPSVAKPNWSRNDSVVEGNEDTSSEATIPDCHPQDSTQNEVVNDKFDRLSDSLTSPICDIEISQSSVRRAQEWVNKSPVPQQRSFVKSKSLIDASASHLSLEQQQNFNLSSSLTSEIFRGAAARYTADVPRPVAQLTYHPAPHSENTSDTICPPGSPSVHRKSPKLQGLILCVDPAGLVSSTSQISPNQTAAVSADQAPKPMISTQQLFFADKKTQLPMTTVPKPPSSLIAQQMNKMMNANKTAYTAKTVASTLSTSYSLAQPPISQPSPVYNSNQTPVLLTSGVSVRHHLTSPTPSSPSAERVSLSGRSDTLSASSSRGAFLKPPSDSSDTESIASTGPMLDDDQVELINMDFSEQSIGSEAVDDSAYFGEDRMPVPRGHWSRMSLPPRLSYLEGFLERARLYSSSAGQKNDDNFEDKAVSEDSTDSSPSYLDNSEPIDMSASRSPTVLNAEGKQNEDFCHPDNTIDLSGKKNGVNLSTPTATVIESSSVLSKDPQDNISTCDMKAPDTQTGQAVDKSDDSADSPNHLHNVAKDGSLPLSAAADWDKSEYFV
ncbi:uncharacterized protein LOC106069192 [Biomphalaria glabrata]|uniref:SH3 domain-binding protein 5-like n=1 Tax=Biomphalaria glabrata TaxID=6526 RepID=A0A9W3BQ48_BIOGL|nr:uncharacterized protein LOC106069192 [Biomphalaria glabrata]